MGQKIHPTGLRIGINKNHNSKWFLSYRHMSEALRLDYNVRELLRQEFEELFTKSGIVNFELHQRSDLFIVTLYSEHPLVLLKKSERTGTLNFLEMEKKLMQCINRSKKISLQIVPVLVPEIHSLSIAKYLAQQIEKRTKYRKLIRKVRKNLQTLHLENVKIQLSGRLDSAIHARTEWFQDGRVTLQTLRANMDYTKYQAYTKDGIIGIKVWLLKDNIPSLV